MEIELPDGTILDAPDDADASAVARAYISKQGIARSDAAAARTDPALYNKRDAIQKGALQAAGAVTRGVGLAGRTVMNAVTGLPLLAMDAGVGARNLMGGDYELPSQTWNNALNAYGVPQHEGMLEKGGDILGQMAIGGRLPAPSAAMQAPTNFNVNTVRDMTLAASQKAGYTIPPATAKPSPMNKIMEGAAGKLSTAQAASAKNQATTNELAKKALGITGEITPAAIDSVAADAFSKGYAPLRAVGVMRADGKYATDLAAASAKFTGAAKSFPEMAGADVTDMVAKMDKKSFDTGSALDTISILRDKASAAYRAGETGLGGAYRTVSKALEDAIERGLARRGKDGAQLLKNFRDARQLIAKTHSVEEALNSSTGTVSATKLAQQLGRGKPLSGDLKTIGQFGQAFPKAAREFNESLPGISPLDFATSGGLGALTKNPWYLGGAFLRPAIRETILSPSGQRALTQPGTPMQPQTPLSLLYGANAVRGLLGQ